jgi:hypothetical protein
VYSPFEEKLKVLKNMDEEQKSPYFTPGTGSFEMP